MGLFKKKASNSNDSSSLSNFIKSSLEGINLQQEAHAATWHLDKAAWDVDMDKGEIKFTLPDRIAVAPVQIIGTLFNGEFMWGWGHPSVPEPLREHAKRAKKWGEKEGVTEYSELKVPANEAKAWEFTAVASRLSEANGVYRGNMGDTLVFMTFGKVTMSKS